MRRFLAFLTRLAFVLMIGLAATGAQDVTIGGSESSPQDIQTALSPRFRSAANAVLVDICVTAREGGFVPALTANDFLVLDNNRPQDVMFFSGEESLPLAVTLLIDRSGSMTGPKLEAAKAAALVFFDTLRPDDLVEVIAFNERAFRLFPLGPDHAAASRSFDGLSGQGLTGLWEAVLVGLRDLEHGQRDRPTRYRHALVILSDGDDTKSLVAFDDVLEDVRRSGVIVYAISFRTGERNRWLAPPRELSQLAFDSGGRAVAVGTAAALARVYDEVGTELRSLYQIGFVPADPGRDGQWRSISVRVPGKDVYVRARSGYYGPRLPPR